MMKYIVGQWYDNRAAGFCGKGLASAGCWLCVCGWLSHVFIFGHKIDTEMYIWLHSVLTGIGKILGQGLGLIVFWVFQRKQPTEENYWVVTFKLRSWLNICIPIHIENVMKENALILHLILVFQRVWICTSAENNNFAAALNYHNDPQHTQILSFLHFILHEIFISARHSWFPLHSKNCQFVFEACGVKCWRWWYWPCNEEEKRTKENTNCNCGFSALLSLDSRC